LRAVQEAFWSLLRAPTGVREELALHSAHAWLVEDVVAAARASPVERLEVYANMYFYRLLEAVKHDFPKLALTLGEVALHNLVTDYLAACPSDSPSLRQLGRRLPAFLREHEVARARPWLVEVAALEWARVEVFDRADQAVLTLDHLAVQAQQGFRCLRLQLIAAHELVPVTFAVDDLWRQLHDREPWCEESEVSPRRGTLLVWRQPDGFVYHQRVELDERGFLAQMDAPLSFLDLCSALGAQLGEQQAATRALTLLARWTSSGLLREQPDEE
jgi:hypothetical protein